MYLLAVGCRKVEDEIYLKRKKIDLRRHFHKESLVPDLGFCPY
jgi:hypothetical protein